MAQPGETPKNPVKPALPAVEAPTRSATAKRPRDESDAAAAASGAPSPKRRLKSEMDILFRIVVPSRQIGKVIGKEGVRIQKIREETKATIKIADAIARHEERVIIISSKDNDGTISDAENALFQIVNLILKDDDGNQEAMKVGGHVAANTIRFLIAGSQAGSLIGVSGQNIEKLRISTGATITVLAQSQLPLCASAYESDRVVQVSGDLSSVMKALEEIGRQLRDNPPKETFALKPTYHRGLTRLPQQYVDPNSAGYATLEMVISETMIGGLIGRCGSNISRIRLESGAAIKVYGGKGEQNQRQIHIGGSAQQVALAKQRIDEYIYSEYIQQAGIQPVSIQPTAMQAIAQSTAMQAIVQPTVVQGSGMMTAFPPFYASTTANQAPAYPGFYPGLPYPAQPM